MGKVNISISIESEKLKNVQTEMLNLFEDCNCNEKNVNFKPHITIGQIHENKASEFVETTSFEEIEIMIDHVTILQKSKGGVFKEATRLYFSG
jgi:2'-5' RNA ligase